MKPGLDETNPASLPSADQVVQYLQADPSFFQERPDLLAALLPPRKFGDNVEDLQFFTLKALRAELSALRLEVKNIVANARHNMSIQNRIHAAVLDLLAADTPEALDHVIAEKLPSRLQLETVILLAEPGLPPALADIVYPAAPNTVNDMLKGDNLRLRPMVAFPDPGLYGDVAEQIQSEALIRLSPPDADAFPPLLLVLASRTGGTFQPDQGTELLTFLADAIGTCLCRWTTR